MKVFNNWWEYFVVIWWSFCPPPLQKISSEKPDSLNVFNEKYTEAINSLSIDEQKFLYDKLSSIEEQNNKNTDIIENKAHSIISQSSLGITLLVVAISLLTTQVENISSYVFYWVLFFVLIIVLNNVVSALLSRNVILLKYEYPQVVIEDINNDSKLSQSIVEKLFINKHYQFINNIKTTFLFYSHWYYKITLIFLLALAISLPVIFIVAPLNKKVDNNSSPTTIYNINSKNGHNVIVNDDSTYQGRSNESKK
ncbi:MAG: hypothetical protein FD122_2861 [Stygiobacter sp.]|nr:MAG: hypothetical protein FD122_2861 [Stygiobacter sp.]KAF0213912.1 MAG: hypothetical protein FD178_2751 [Ignavibacteria bacterium]